MSSSNNKNSSSNQKRSGKTHLLKTFLQIFLPTSLLLSGIFYAFTQLSSEYELQTIQIRDASTLRSASEVTALILEQRLSDLLVLAEGETLRKYLHDGSMKNWIHLAREFSLFARRKPQYVQIRLIGNDGMEMVRVNNRDGMQSIVPKTKLQDKSQRYYFRDSINLSQGEIYSSPLDLNVENGNIVVPYEPTIRFATPVLDGYGTKRGVIVINYSPDELLDRFRQFFSSMNGEVVMLNPEGYWLMGSDTDKLWGFMFDSPNTFAKEHPDIWQRMNRNDSGNIAADEGIFIYQKAYLFSLENIGTPENIEKETNGQHGEPYWILISKVSNDLIRKLSTSRTVITISTYISLFLLSGFISYFFSKVASQRQLAYQQLEEHAVTDALTGISNRRELMISGEREVQRAKRFNRQLCVMMLDLDHFKRVNDTYGHHLGDHMLKHFSTICKSSIREQDLLARFGGEEFVVTMPETGIEGARDLAERICSNVRKQPYRHNGEEIPVTVSIGVTAFLQTDRDYAQILDRADYALYQAKSLGRDRCEVIQEDRDSQIDSDGHKTQGIS
jgi:diguanylate cyclase (GGDEF)-like protein